MFRSRALRSDFKFCVLVAFGCALAAFSCAICMEPTCTTQCCCTVAAQNAASPSAACWNFSSFH
eukprot:11113718-Alexandrium_andersonii.AAC.1